MKSRTWLVGCLVALLPTVATAAQVANVDGGISIRSWDPAGKPGRNTITFLWSPSVKSPDALYSAGVGCLRDKGRNKVTAQFFLAGVDSGAELRLPPLRGRMIDGNVTLGSIFDPRDLDRFSNDSLVVVIVQVAVQGKVGKRELLACQAGVSEFVPAAASSPEAARTESMRQPGWWLDGLPAPPAAPSEEVRR